MVTTKDEILEKLKTLIEQLPAETQYTLLLKELNKEEIKEKRERVKELIGSVCTLVIVSSCTLAISHPEINKSLEQLLAINSLITSTPVVNITTTKQDSPPKVTGRYQVNGTHLLLTRTGNKDEFQLEKLRLDLVDSSGNVLDSVNAVSGSWRKQDKFMGGGESPRGKLYPVEAGIYNLRSPVWVGRPGVFKGNLNGNPGLGPVSIPMSPTFNTARSAIEIHLDANNGLNYNAGGSAGTAGCVGIRTLGEMKKVINWLNEHKISQIIVDTVY
jgi:hypothetical protein